MGITGIPPDVVLRKVLYARALPFFILDFVLARIPYGVMARIKEGG
jgi:hypothetical protein